MELETCALLPTCAPLKHLLSPEAKCGHAGATDPVVFPSPPLEAQVPRQPLLHPLALPQLQGLQIELHVPAGVNVLVKTWAPDARS